MAQSKTATKLLPPSFKQELFIAEIDHIQVYPPSAEIIAAEDAEDEKNGTFLKVARLIPVNVNLKNSGTWETLDNGQQIWRLRFSSEGAKGSALYFDKFDIPQGSSVYLYTSDRSIVDGPYFRSDNPSGNEFMIGNILGNDITIEYVAPLSKDEKGNLVNSTSAPIINIGEYAFVYRDEGAFARGVRTGIRSTGFGSSESCEVNVNCSVGADWRIQQRGVARIYVREGSSAGYCTGSLINNTNNDGTPYFLTANHCGPSATASNFNQWKFRFNYEASGCSNPSYESSIDYTDFTGCTKVSEGACNGGSDFFLLKLNNFSTQDAISVNAVYNGWDRSSSAPTGGGAGIHHPSGDIKKISFFTSTPTSATYAGDMNGASGAHWKVYWSGEGVTEGGSSGSSIFNSNGRIFGTLSGGASSCDVSSYYKYDLYGKMSVHWNNSANGSTNAYKLQPWLDPTNSGATTCDYYVTANGSGSGGGENPPTSSDFSYDFESCQAWAVDAFSPCTTYDGDGSATYGINNVSFTNSGYTGSFIAFQNGTADSFTAHGGTKFGCCMAATTPPNNDWFITPPTVITSGTVFSFWARSANDTYGLEQFRVAVSTNDQNYTYVDGGSSISAPVEWTHYTCDLSEYAGQTLYIAIICVSDDVFAFFIDDIAITSNSSVSETSVNNLVNLFPNPATDNITITLPEANATIDIVNVLGQIVKTVNTTSVNETISLEGLEKGMYIFNIKLTNETIMKKVIVE